MAALQVNFVTNKGAATYTRTRIEVLTLTKRRKATRIIEEGAQDCLQTMKELVAVRTGELRSDLAVRVVYNNNGGIKIVVGTEHTRHGKFVEFGTRFMPAQPFVRPAADKHGPLISQRLRELKAE